MLTNITLPILSTNWRRLTSSYMPPTTNRGICIIGIPMDVHHTTQLHEILHVPRKDACSTTVKPTTLGMISFIEVTTQSGWQPGHMNHETPGSADRQSRGLVGLTQLVHNIATGHVIVKVNFRLWGSGPCKTSNLTTHPSQY